MPKNISDILGLEDLEKRYILRVIDLFNGSVTQAAKSLGVNASTLYR